jgi:DNA-binding response OmpR family regulator
MGAMILVVDDEAKIVKLVRAYLTPIIMVTARVEHTDRIETVYGVGYRLGSMI